MPEIHIDTAYSTTPIVDVQKWAAGNKAAGTRVRKAMQEIKKIAQEVRVAVLAGREDASAF